MFVSKTKEFFLPISILLYTSYLFINYSSNFYSDYFPIANTPDILVSQCHSI